MPAGRAATIAIKAQFPAPPGTGEQRDSRQRPLTPWLRRMLALVKAFLGAGLVASQVCVIPPCQPLRGEEITRSSTRVSRRCRSATILDPKLASRSRGTEISTGPASFSTVSHGPARLAPAPAANPPSEALAPRQGPPVTSVADVSLFATIYIVEAEVSEISSSAAEAWVSSRQTRIFLIKCHLRRHQPGGN